MRRRAIVVQQKTGRPVQFEITEQARRSVADWLNVRPGEPNGWLFPSRFVPGAHLSTRQYIRLVKGWIARIGLEPAAYGSHSLRRAKVSLLYRKTGNLRACQLLLEHTKLESTARYVGVELDDAWRCLSPWSYRGCVSFGWQEDIREATIGWGAPDGIVLERLFFSSGVVQPPSPPASRNS